MECDRSADLRLRSPRRFDRSKFNNVSIETRQIITRKKKLTNLDIGESIQKQHQ